MKRLLIGTLLILLLSSSIGATALSYTYDEVLAPLYAQAIEEHLGRELTGRLTGSAAVRAHLSEDRLLTLSGEAGSLELRLSEEIPLATELISEVLYWDLHSLLGKPNEPYLSFPLREGFIIEGIEKPSTGTFYWVTDPAGVTLGTLITTVKDVESGSVVAAQRSGKTLKPGMLVEQRRVVEFGLFAQVDTKGAFGGEAVMRYPLKIYPLSLLGSVYAGKRGIAVSVGVGGTLYGSSLFGTKRTIARNLSLEGWALAGVGYEQQITWRADGRVGLTYRFGDWSVTAMVGNQVVISKNSIVTRGLLFTLGTAYTMKQ